MVLPVYTLLRASILDFRPRVANRCSTIVAAVRNGFACGDRRGCDVPRPILIFVAAKKNGPLPERACYCASILDLRGSIWESLHGFAWKRPRFCSDS